MGIRKKAKDKQRAMQVPSYTYARMTRRRRSAPNTFHGQRGLKNSRCHICVPWWTAFLF